MKKGFAPFAIRLLAATTLTILVCVPPSTFAGTGSTAGVATVNFSTNAPTTGTPGSAVAAEPLIPDDANADIWGAGPLPPAAVPVANIKAADDAGPLGPPALAFPGPPAGTCPNDNAQNLDGLDYFTLAAEPVDIARPAVPPGIFIQFSVTRASVGLAAGPFAPLDVFGEAALGEAAGDVFETPTAAPGANYLITDEDALGLMPGFGAQDDVDALEVDEVLGGQTPLFSTDFISGAVPVPLYPGAALLSIPGFGGALAGPCPGGASIYRTPADLGLLAGDDIDAMFMDATPTAPFVPGGPPIGDLFFSLRPGSPTLGLLGAGPADILVTTPSVVPGGGVPQLAPAIWLPAAALGLAAGDNIDGLDMSVVPNGPAPLLVPVVMSHFAIE